MAKTAEPLKIVEERAIQVLQETGDKLELGDSAVVLDFPAIPRIESKTLTALEELANKADERSVRIVLRGVKVDVYKVLKLVKLASRFSFDN